METLTLLRGAPLPSHDHEHTRTTTPSDKHDHDHHPPNRPEEPKASAVAAACPPSLLDEPTLTAALQQLPKESVYRVKGFIRFSFATPSGTATPATTDAGADAESRPWWILNWAFGRWDLVRASSPVIDEDEKDGDGDKKQAVVRLTVMGERGEVRRYAERLAKALGTAVA